MTRMASPVAREELPKAAAAAAAAGAVVAAGKMAHSRFARGKFARGYRLKDGETVPDGIARIAYGRIDHAIDELRGKNKSSREEAVHEARKDLKKLRSLLRLVRGEIGDEVYRRENEGFREAGRRLSGVRDADVMIETLESLAEHRPKDMNAETVGGLRQALSEHRAALEGNGRGRKQARNEVVQALRESRERVEEWPLETDGFDALEDGLGRAYRRGRRAYHAVLEDPSTENLHEWRKRVKDLWYHHTLLQCSWPELMDPAADQVHELSDLLGDDHDLAVLCEWAQAHPAAAGGMPGLEAFNEAARRRRTELQREALVLGERLYGERPRAFLRRLRSYWHAWREAPRPARRPGTAR
jgi:CHAD domain-containing protein